MTRLAMIAAAHLGGVIDARRERRLQRNGWRRCHWTSGGKRFGIHSEKEHHPLAWDRERRFVRTRHAI